MNLGWIPDELKRLDQWVLWRTSDERKRPVSTTMHMASVTNPATWSSFSAATEVLNSSLGLGFVFSDSDPLVGIDLDGCRRPSGQLAPWAKEIILKFRSYCEVSPSGSGVKVWVKSCLAEGHRLQLPHPWTEGKSPGIEVYARGRYFTVTTRRLEGMDTIREVDLGWLVDKYWPQEDQVIQRAKAYLATMREAVSGEKGHNSCFRAACAMVLGFDLDPETAFTILWDSYNPRCVPPWSEKDLRHKVDDADRQAGARGYLVGLKRSEWSRVKLPEYHPPPRQTTLAASTRTYAEKVYRGEDLLIETGLPDLDYAIGGGIAPGELVVLGGRPTHCKSAIALQLLHHITLTRPALLISEEMSAMALGKRSLLYLTGVPEEHWATSQRRVESDIDRHFGYRKECLVLESCGNVDVACQQIEVAAQKHEIGLAVVDYVQLLKAQGSSRYEQVTNVSMALRRTANDTGVAIVMLCQLSRAIEFRTNYQPNLADLKESGQLEQDADVVLFVHWPYRSDPTKDPKSFVMFVSKNRNRAINSPRIEMEFDALRQTVRIPDPSYIQRQL